MSDRYRHYGWPVSPYSAKTRTYLRFKRIPFDDIEPSALALARTIKKAVGRMVMPTVRTPDGQWLQDSSVIIDTLEARHPTPAIEPPGGCQRVAALLLENYADEWLPIVSMHTRWNVPENAAFARSAFARHGVPWLPGPLGRLVVRPIADRMQGYRGVLGVTPETAPGIDRVIAALIAALDVHFAEHDFLLGGRPCIGDFALHGPLWAHVYRDPGTTALFADAPHVRAWFDRLIEPPEGMGDWLPDDVVPATLDPVFSSICAEQMAWVRDLTERIDAWCEAHPDATRVPRSLGDHAFTIGGARGTRRLVTFSQWMAQRPLDAHAALEGDDRARADAWLGRFGAVGTLDITIRHRFVRRGFAMGLERTPADVGRRP